MVRAAAHAGHGWQTAVEGSVSPGSQAPGGGPGGGATRFRRPRGRRPLSGDQQQPELRRLLRRGREHVVCVQAAAQPGHVELDELCSGGVVPRLGSRDPRRAVGRKAEVAGIDVVAAQEGKQPASGKRRAIRT